MRFGMKSGSRLGLPHLHFIQGYRKRVLSSFAAPQALCPVIFLTLPVFVWMERRHTAVATEIGSNAHHTHGYFLKLLCDAKTAAFKGVLTWTSGTPWCLRISAGCVSKWTCFVHGFNPSITRLKMTPLCTRKTFSLVIKHYSYQYGLFKNGMFILPALI